MPHTYIILFIIVLFVCMLTYLIPAGQFERQEDPTTGRVLIVPGTYQKIDPSPVSPLSIPVEFFNTLAKANISEIIFFIFIVGGAFELIIKTGMISSFCGLLDKKMIEKEKLVIPIFVILFSICGFTMGMSMEALIFVPIGIAVARSIGYDTITGTAMILLVVVAGFGILIYGVSSRGWFISEMAATFLVMGVLCGFLSGMTANDIYDVFVNGASQITYGALIIGVAGTIQTVMIDGKIIDTIVNSLVTTTAMLPGYLQIISMFLTQTIINLPINSGTGQAAATMPIMIPVADLLGISRQTAVLAFQLGDGFTNAIFPTSSTMLGFLAASRIPYDKWLKYAVPLVGIYAAISIVFLIIAQSIHY